MSNAAAHGEALKEMVVNAINVINGEAGIPSGNDDGPWTISVADAPSHNNKKKYTIYIQTPTQNLTLTRAAQEITDLHAKLRSNHPSASLPALPGSPASGSEGGDNAKRRSSFLNTLSRLANPSPKMSKAKAIGSMNASANANTPMISPQSSIDDPLAHPSVSQPTGVAPGEDGVGEQTMPALAAYLTLIGNHPIFRNSRAWRRFVRVRTDDLESVRAERVVKRVRSEGGLGRSGSQGGSAADLGRVNHDVRSGKPVLELPSLPTMSSRDVRGSVSEASEGIAEEEEDDQVSEKDLPHLPGSSERTPSGKPASEHNIADQDLFNPVDHDPDIVGEMVVDATNVVPNGEAETPSGNDDGPWTISVADAPSHNNKKKYTIYIQTPTQNLTLTRAAQEITDLHAKLRSNHPSASLPALPGSPASGSEGGDNAKRRSSFLNTLSRLANPSPKMPKAKAIANTDAQGEEGHAEQTMPALAAYLTLIGNHPIFRRSRAWRRFARVRTDDLQSLRAERVVKRVRSEGGLGRSGSQGGSAADLGRVSHDVRSGKPVPELPSLPTMSSRDVRGSVSEASEGIAEEEADDQVSEKDLPHLPGSSERTPSGKPAALPDGASIPPLPPVSEILASPSMQQAIATPLPPGTPEPSTPAQKNSAQLDVGSSAPTVFPREEEAARKVVVGDFEMMKVLGKGCAGKVLLIRHRASDELYALKAISKRHVLAHQELQHTLAEQAVLKRMARESRDPFVVKLRWSFHDQENLFLVTDFHPGGDLATQLARWGRLDRDRVRFYAMEIVEGCEGLHAAGIIYRDLKPDNVLIGADGHIVLTDFGLSKEFPRKFNGHSPVTPSARSTPRLVAPHWMDAAGSPGRASTSKRLDRDMTSTFCGTAEYLAPEVIQGLPYSYEVDWWSFGTMLYEMLTGITPFWANNHSDMYVRVLQDELQFPDDKAMDQDTQSLIRGLLQRNPALRMCEPRVKKHPYFSMIDWQHVYYKPPYIPPIDPANAGDTQNFDEAFLDMEPVITDETDQTDSEREESDSESARTTSCGKSPERTTTTEEETDVFDGYSFKGRGSIIIDDEEESEDDEHEEDEEDERIRDAKVLEPEVDVGLITVQESQPTPHPSTELPETPSAASKLPEPETVAPVGEFEIILAQPQDVPANNGVSDSVPIFVPNVPTANEELLSQMSCEEMFQRLVDHGCVNLASHMDPKQYSTGLIAGGGFGDIWKGRLHDGTEVAIKVLRFSLVTHNGAKAMKRAMREVYHWSKIKHENIQELMGVTMFQERLGMVSLWMDHGNLREYLCKYPNSDRLPLCTQVAKGVLYLHDREMVHGDLKAANILVSRDGVAKLSDFDHSIMSEFSVAFSETSNKGGGTTRWMAPELILDDTGSIRRNARTDVYALGMTFLEIVTGTSPYYPECREDTHVIRAVMQKRLPKRQTTYFGDNARDNQMWELLLHCWNHEPGARPKAAEVLESLSALPST